MLVILGHADPGDDRHTVAFMFTDGDSIAFDVEEFASAQSDWWASPLRGRVPIAWTVQPVLQELDPVFLEWVSMGCASQCAEAANDHNLACSRAAVSNR